MRQRKMQIAGKIKVLKAKKESLILWPLCSLMLFAFFSAVIMPAQAMVGWQELPNTKLQDACPPDNFGGQNYAFNFNCRMVISAWGGAIADTSRNRLILWGGGHSDYAGNELY